MAENNIPEEHQLECSVCKKILDMRDLGQVLSHGIYNETLKVYECLPEEKDIPYTLSKKEGDSVQWTKDKKPLNLN